MLPIKLNLVDKKILFELDENSRQPLSKIAKKVRLSKEAVYYRIKNLEKKEIITSYTTVVSLAKLGLMHIKLLVKFQNINKIIKRKIIDYFVAHGNTNWVGTLHGFYDFMVGFVVRDLAEFNKIKNNFFDKYNQYILNSDTSTMIEAYVYGRKYLLNKSQEIRHYIGAPEKIKLDKLDFSILKILSTNTRLKVTEIAVKLKTTARKVTYRIKQLEKNRIIQKYTISINHSLLGISFFKPLIYLRNIKKKELILNYLENQNKCLLNVEVLSKWNLEPEFEVFSNEEFYKIMEEIEDKFSDSIKTIDTILISKEYKFELLPRAIKQNF